MPRPDIIAAIATPAGRGGIGIVRVSGPNLTALASGVLGRVPAPRVATLAQFMGADGAPLDEGIAVFFEGPASYTGEDVLELQGHGGMAVLDLILKRCLELGARIAEPGEFTRRAFLNGRMDLAQAEGVADIIDAATGAAARSALRSLRGEFSHEVHALREGLVELRALTEASIDFPEEGLEFAGSSESRARLEALRGQVDELAQRAQRGNLLREGAHVVLVGKPNVGKSSVLNRLAREEVAIVTEVPGTTRDPIRQALDIDGVPFHVVDTAGLRESADRVEQMGIERTWSAVRAADMVVLVVDCATGRDAEDDAIVGALPGELPHVAIYNKIDLAGIAPGIEEHEGETRVYVSALHGDGIDLLRRELLARVGWSGNDEGVYMARARHLEALAEVRERLEAAAGHLTRVELFAEELSLAQRALGRITGEASADDLLGEIFSRFCIGK